MTKLYCIGKRFPGPVRGGYGGKLSTNVKPKNPFQLSSSTTDDTQQQETGNPFSSASKPPSFPVQSGQLFSSAGNAFSNNTNPFLVSSASTAVTSSALPVGRSYAQALKTGGRNLNDPRLQHTAPTLTSNKPDPDSHNSNIQDLQSEQHSSQNPFSKPPGFKFTHPKQVGGHGGASGLQKLAPPTAHQYMVTLSVRNIDQKLCKPEILRSHFQQFGDVCDLKCMPRKGMATVSYSDHVSLYFI